MRKNLPAIMLINLILGYGLHANAAVYLDGTGPAAGTVTDLATGLVWQKQDDGTTRTWANAIAYCESLSLGGATDWRLPNIKEVFSLIDDTRTHPAIDPLFVGARNSAYWTSTSVITNNTQAWEVFFDYGYNDQQFKSVNVYVRCVRGP